MINSPIVKRRMGTRSSPLRREPDAIPYDKEGMECILTVLASWVQVTWIKSHKRSLMFLFCHFKVDNKVAGREFRFIAEYDSDRFFQKGTLNNNNNNNNKFVR